MRHGHAESPLNPLPAVVWALVLPIVATEVAFGLAAAGFFGGPSMRVLAIEATAWVPDLALRLWQWGGLGWRVLLRLLTFPFVHYSLTHAAFVAVFALALGKQLAEVFRPWAVLALFFASAVGAALVYTLLQALTGWRLSPLVGGYPAVYGFVGAFTFLLWTRLGQMNASRMRAFSLIGFLLLFQLAFGILFGAQTTDWMADITGFAIGFLLSPLVMPGGIARVGSILRRR